MNNGKALEKTEKVRFFWSFNIFIQFKNSDGMATSSVIVLSGQNYGFQKKPCVNERSCSGLISEPVSLKRKHDDMTLLRKHAFKYEYTMQIETNNVKVTDDLASLLRNNDRLWAICEHLMNQNRRRQYFDFDIPYEQSVLTFSFEFIMSEIEHKKDVIRDIYKDIISYELDLKCAQRVNPINNKLSLHIIVKNVVSTPQSMIELIVKDNAHLKDTEHLDLSVYKELGRAQKFRCVNTCKNAQEDKQYYLQPLDDDLEGYCIQVHPDTPCSYEYTSQAKFEKKKRIINKKTGEEEITYKHVYNLKECQFYISVFKNEVQTNEKLRIMSEDYSEWIRVLIALYTAGASIELARSFSMLSSKHNDYELQRKWNSFKHYEKHGTSLKTLLSEIELKGDHPTFTPHIVRGDEWINNIIDDVLEHKTVALRATYGMGKTFGGLTPLVQYLLTEGFVTSYVL